jgi:hypothetical protein
MEAEEKSAMIIGNHQRILGQQLRPHPTHLLNIIIIRVITD